MRSFPHLGLVPSSTALWGGVFALALLLRAGPAAAEDPQRELEPVPRMVAFRVELDGRINAQARERIEEEIQNTFSSLSDVLGGRALLVRRYGVLAAPSLAGILRRSSNETEAWNAALTVGALRDTEGASLELKQTLRPLLRLADDRSETPHLRAFCSLALGCFPWPEAVLPKRYADLASYYTAVPAPARKWKDGVRDLTEARRVLLKRAVDKHAFSAISALLAIAKVGGPELQQGLLTKVPNAYANAQPKRAHLLARAFLLTPDEKPYFGLDGLRNDESRIRSAAALAIAVSMLQQKPPEWTRDSTRTLKALKRAEFLLSSEAEAVFARGVSAYVNQQNAEWEELWNCATTPSSKRNCAAAASQMLVFCDLPWFRQEVVAWAKKPGDAMKDSVLGLVLLRAGEMGTDESVATLGPWLGSKARRPGTNSRWDPRWYAAIGILRALHAGRLIGQEERREALETLERALRKGFIHKDTPIWAALRRVLDEHGERIVAPKESALYTLPTAALRSVERSFRCPHGLLASDPIESCVRRVNQMMWDIYALDNLPPNKPGEVRLQPERYLKRYLAEYPYFSRLEFRTRRGFRELPSYEERSELVFDR